MARLTAVLKHLLRLVLCSSILAGGYTLIRCIAGVALPSINPFLPTLLQLCQALSTLFTSGEMWGNLAITGLRIGLSLTLTIFVGALLGLTIGSFPPVHRFLRPVWDFLRSIPPSAMFPFLVLLLGIGVTSKIATTWFTTTLIYAVGVADAAATARELRGRFFRLVGVRRSDWYISVMLPESLLRSVSALRIVVSITVALMIVCEMFLGAVDGFGGMIIGFSEALRYADLLAAIIIAGVIGYGLNLAVDSLDRAARRRLLSEREQVSQ